MMKELFTKHPKSVGETYWSHLIFASVCGIKLVLAGMACIIHAIFPFVFENTASNTTKDIQNKLTNRK